MRLWGMVVAALVLLLGSTAMADELLVAAASDLQFALPEVISRFQKETGNKVSVTFGSSGNFYSQIANGAPFDVFLSADAGYPRKLIEAGAAEGDSFFLYAVGQIALWTPQNSKLDLNKGMDVLLSPEVKKIALANPQHAPYGRAAVAALRHANLYDRLAGKFVLGENISQTMHFIESGNADVGFIALSLATAPPVQGKGRYWTVPQDFYPAIEQGAVVVTRSSHKQAARQFLQFLRRPEIVDLMRHYGFAQPEKAK